jgi:glutamine amidotransferase
MCELFALSSLRTTRLTFSLETLAAHGAGRGRYRDGWGTAFYQGNDVALFREPAAAGNSALVRFLETQAPDTTLAISHIRRATRGAVTLANTQPFARQLAGRMHVFAHNGDLPGIERSGTVVSDRYRPVGATDSEHAFCALLGRMETLWGSSLELPALDKRLAVVTRFAADLRELGPANFLYTDGETLFAHGHRRLHPDTGMVLPPGLFIHSCECVDPGEPMVASGVAVAPGFQKMTLLASVPLSNETWRPLTEGEVVAVSAGSVVGSALP